MKKEQEKINKLNQFLIDFEEIKDLIYQDNDIIGYFILVVDKEGKIIIKYESTSYQSLIFAVDSMLFDLKLQLNKFLNNKDE